LEGCLQAVRENEDNAVSKMIHPGDFAELNRQTGILLDDSRYLRVLGQNARQKSTREFGLNRMIDETVKTFELALKRSRTQR
jgi:hypothetical protein